MHDRKRLVPDDFVVPETLEHPRFRLRMLEVNDVVKDYDAVMTSVEHLQKTFSVGGDGVWPEGLTFEDDLIDLGWHQREFTIRSSFAYTMMAPDESRCLGCMYIDPTLKSGHDAKVTMWVRADELDGDLDAVLYETVRGWIDDAWPFTSPTYPGREISFEDWRGLPEV
ncbi:MAG: GNAT family N-acetyltransferase [Rhodospirillaceae bacterium]|nr:GNAT family N-acetyltransferase [Rhodospirillaceae bacterium]|tara:strand:+ start:29056 stop:29559 length:504 start_codon:yes stop_codon:yes gene_type:complete